jgi:outer membrane protein TolC
MKNILYLPFLFLTFLLMSSLVTAETNMPGGAERPDSQQILDLMNKKEIHLSLKSCLQLALKNNLEIAVESVNPEINNQKVVQEKSAFDPTASLTVSKDRTVKQVGSALALPPQNETDNINLDAGVSSKWVTGTETGLHFTSNRNDSNSVFAGLNPAYSSELILSLTQPLLKDFGIQTNTTQIRIASNNQEISKYQFQDRVMEVLFSVESAYWELVFAGKELDVEKESLRLADDFLKITRRKVEVGLLPEVEILQAEAEKAAREEGVISAEDSLRDAEDGLRKILNLSEEEKYWEISLLPSDKPSTQPFHLLLSEQLIEAFKNRPDLNQAKMDLKNKKILLKYSKNQLFPRVDLVGSLGVSGLAGNAVPQQDFSNPGQTVTSPFAGTYPDSVRELKSGDNYSYSLGIQVTYPLGNRSAKSQMIIADLEKQKAILALKDLENQVIKEVRGAFRQIETNKKRIAAAELARKLAEERLETETKRFEVGLATSHDVLEYQEKLAQAKSDELRARIDYQTSLADLERVKGTLLQSKGITF